MIGKVGVDSGLILCIDPCVLFGDKEWRKIVGEEDDDKVCAAIVKAIQKKHKLVHLTAACFPTKDGDGFFEVERVYQGVVIKDA